jgi:hypothetical protein
MQITSVNICEAISKHTIWNRAGVVKEAVVVTLGW